MLTPQRPEPGTTPVCIYIRPDEAVPTVLLQLADPVSPQMQSAIGAFAHEVVYSHS